MANEIDVFTDLETLIKDEPENNELIRQINQNFGDIYLKRLTEISVSLDTFQENQGRLDEELHGGQGMRKLMRGFKQLIGRQQILSVDDLYTMQRECLEYMRNTLHGTLDASKNELEKLQDYGKGLLMRLKKGQELLGAFEGYVAEEKDEENVYEKALQRVNYLDSERKKEFAVERLQQFMLARQEHFQDVRNLLAALQGVVEVYTLVHDQVVVAASDLEIVMGGHRIMEQTSQMSPRYAKGMRQLQSFGKELHKRLELGVRRLSRLKEVTVKHYVS